MTTLDARLQAFGIKPIGDDFIPATEMEIQEIEARLGELPADYEQFLSEYGYAMFDGANVVSAPLPGGDEAPIDVFFGGGASRAPVLELLERYRDQLPPGTLPIARDPFGNLFLIEVGASHAGQVWYLSFEDYQAVPVARSFEDFLDRLTVDPDIDD